MRIVFGFALLLSGCSLGSDASNISGTVRLDVDVDVDQAEYQSLEIRGFYEIYEQAAMTYIGLEHEPAFTATVPASVPYGFSIEGVGEGPVLVIAWLAHERGAPAVRAGEPVGKTIAEVCECATDAPPYALDVAITIDGFAGDQ